MQAIFYFLHTWQDIAVCTDVDSDGVFRSAPSCCFSPVCNVLHAIYAARMSSISDTAAQLQQLESQLEDVRALLARQARTVHVACYKLSECSSHLQCAFFYFLLFRWGVVASGEDGEQHAVPDAAAATASVASDRGGAGATASACLRTLVFSKASICIDAL